MLPKVTAKPWLLGVSGAVFYTAAQTMQIAPHMPKVPWLELYLFELPVWSAVLVISPAIFYVARRFPLVGPRAGRNFFAHLIPCTLLLLAMFFLVETMRQFAITPLVSRLGIATTPEAIRYMNFGADMPLLRRTLTSYRVYATIFSLVYFAIVFLYYGIVYNRELLQSQVREQELKEMLTRTQLSALKSQLQPHFLFNTLNTVSSLMTRDVALARRMLAKLGDLLRQSLRDSAEHETTLRNELHFLDIYLEIQEARFGSRLVVERDIDSKALSASVPQMILQPIVENSIRHGMTDRVEGLRVFVAARINGPALELRVSDNGPGSGSPKIREGVGIRNTRERLAQLYGAESSLSILQPPTGGFEVAITVPLRISDAYVPEELRDSA